jgi:hypothetical protein
VQGGRRGPVSGGNCSPWEGQWREGRLVEEIMVLGGAVEGFLVLHTEGGGGGTGGIVGTVRIKKNEEIKG